MEKRTLYVIIAVVLVAALVLSFYKFTGQSTLGTDKGACVDDDGGDDPYVAGSVTYTNRDDVYSDECYSTGTGPVKWLKERYCLDGIRTKRYRCEDGCIEDESGAGACVETGEAEPDLD